MVATILRLPRVMQRTGLPRSSIYSRMAEGTFPKSISLSGRRENGRKGRAVGWVESEINRWIQEQIDETRNSDQSENVRKKV